MSIAIRSCLILAAVCLLIGRGAAQTFTVHSDEVLCEKWVGFGAELNPWTYCEPNSPDVTEENVKDMEQKVIALGPQHVRIFALPKWYDDDYDPSARQSLVRVCKLAREAGASVNITYWGGKFDAELGRKNARMIEKLIRQDGLGDVVRYVTLQNEPNSTKISPLKYNELYQSFDEAMRKNGLRDQIELVGGDLVSTNQETWFANLVQRLSPILEGYSVHMYSNYWDNDHIRERLESVSAIYDQIPRELRRPLYLMEFGVRGHRRGHDEPGRHDDGRAIMDVPYASMLNGWVMLEAINRGYCAAVQWDMADLCSDRSRMYYGIIGEPAKGWPLKPGYHLMSLFTHASGTGWETLKTTGDAEDRLVSAMRGPAGEWSIFALNRASQPLPIQIDGVPSDATFAVRCWNANGDGKLTEGLPVTTTARGRATLAVARQSLLVLTTGK